MHAQSLKELANDNFRQGNIKKAKNIYHKIFAFTSGLQEGSSSGIPMLDAFRLWHVGRAAVEHERHERAKSRAPKSCVCSRTRTWRRARCGLSSLSAPSVTAARR